MAAINELVNLVSEINTANGWREDTGDVLTEDSPEAQIAAMSHISMQVSEIIELIRKPEKGDMYEALKARRIATSYICHVGLGQHTHWYLQFVTNEYGIPVYGSKTRAICSARLMDTETAELTRAILNNDVENIAEEVADGDIRHLDFVGGWNEAHQDRPIDLQAAIMAKLERNRKRGWKHGGKRA